jgi:tripartite-type tricarboxylate transporter receptor subunit TctC
MVGMNKLYTSEPDGLTIASGVGWSFGLYAPHVAQKAGMEYELDKFGYIGALAVERPMLSVSPTLGVNTVEDLKKIKNFRWGAGGTDQASAIWGALLIDWLGLDNGKVVTGWETGELGIALASGEVHAASFGGPSTMDWADSGLTHPLVTLGSTPDVGFPELPTFLDQYQLTPEQMATFKINEAFGASFRTWMAPPGLPQDKLDFLQNTFVKITDNEGFRRQYRRRWDHFSRLTGPELEAFVTLALAQPTARIQELQEFTLQYLAAQ